MTFDVFSQVSVTEVPSWHQYLMAWISVARFEMDGMHLLLPPLEPPGPGSVAFHAVVHGLEKFSSRGLKETNDGDMFAIP